MDVANGGITCGHNIIIIIVTGFNIHVNGFQVHMALIMYIEEAHYIYNIRMLMDTF